MLLQACRRWKPTSGICLGNTHLWEQRDGGNLIYMVFKCPTKHFFSVCVSCIARSIVFLVVAGTDTRHAALLLCVLPLISSSVHISVLSFFPTHPSSFPSPSFLLHNVSTHSFPSIPDNFCCYSYSPSSPQEQFILFVRCLSVLHPHLPFDLGQQPLVYHRTHFNSSHLSVLTACK